MNPTTTRRKACLPHFVRKLGAGTFAFFFVKGMLWLAVPALARALWP